MKLFIVPFLMALFATIPVHAADKANERRLDEVAQRGAHVMPFDLEKTTHVFSKTAKGGVQQVIAKDKSDTKQIGLIRTHLSEICEEFKQGDFSRPAKVHGETMQGLAELKTAKASQIRVEYKGLPDGAQINYFTEVPKFKKAIYRWFDAQLSDHARHAIPGHPHQPMHHQ